MFRKKLKMGYGQQSHAWWRTWTKCLSEKIYVHTPVITAALFIIAKTQRQPNGHQPKNVPRTCDLCTTEHCSDTKEREPVPFAQCGHD